MVQVGACGRVWGHVAGCGGMWQGCGRVWEHEAGVGVCGRRVRPMAWMGTCGAGCGGMW